MCGIIGITSNKPVISNIIGSLKKLEYRGYDSAGIATLSNNFIDEVKCEGRVVKLEKICSKKSINMQLMPRTAGNWQRRGKSGRLSQSWKI